MSPTLFLGFVAVVVAVTVLGIRAELREYRRQERFAEAVGDLFGELLRSKREGSVTPDPSGAP